MSPASLIPEGLWPSIYAGQALTQTASDFVLDAYELQLKAQLAGGVETVVRQGAGRILSRLTG
jgi:hypothetical protein